MPEKICTCVAGFLEVGESLEECAKRECWEEVRLNVSNIKYITSATYPPPLINQIMIGLSADALNDDIDIKPGNELCNAFWVDEEMVKKALKNSCEKQPLDWVSPPASFFSISLISALG
ncbi:NAD(+) diphosphatase [Entamoeba marina]